MSLAPWKEVSGDARPATEEVTREETDPRSISHDQAPDYRRRELPPVPPQLQTREEIPQYQKDLGYNPDHGPRHSISSNVPPSTGQRVMPPPLGSRPTHLSRRERRQDGIRLTHPSLNQQEAPTDDFCACG